METEPKSPSYERDGIIYKSERRQQGVERHVVSSYINSLSVMDREESEAMLDEISGITIGESRFVHGPSKEYIRVTRRVGDNSYDVESGTYDDHKKNFGE